VALQDTRVTTLHHYCPEEPLPSGVAHGLRRRAAFAVLLGVLSACQAPDRQVVYAPQEPEREDISPTQTQPSVFEIDDAERHRRYVADILYDGMRALRADRLMTPPEDSAFHYFSRALALEPGNAIALEGMQDILLRYLQLADTASRQGQFDNAESFLRRAAQIDQTHAGIAASRQTLNRERERTHSVHILNARDLRTRLPAVSAQLRELAAIVAKVDAFVLITAPNDEMGRWIYAQIQDALGDYRVRGDIEIGEQPTVRLVLPRANSRENISSSQIFHKSLLI
jgi:tetratricopeptide (TPR) repeat protein